MENSNISSELRQLQFAELEILKELDRVCNKLGLRYLLFSGTLLGAVRHQGFIPWDDDIDVVMFRKDYDQLQREGLKELNIGYFLQTLQSDPEYPNVHLKLRNSKTTFIEESLARRNMNHGIGIDIFPLDGVPENRYLRSLGWFPISVLGTLALIKSMPVKNEKLLVKIAKWFARIIPISGRSLTLIYAKLSSIVNIDKTEHVAFSAWPTDPLNHIVYPKKWFDDTILLEFERTSFPAPAQFHKILTQLYGDYMKLPAEHMRILPHKAVIISTVIPYDEYKHTI